MGLVGAIMPHFSIAYLGVTWVTCGVIGIEIPWHCLCWCGSSLFFLRAFHLPMPTISSG